MKKPLATTLFLFMFTGPAIAADPVDNDPTLQDTFTRIELGKGWNSTTGKWEIREGVLRGSEIVAEKHSAATRRIVETKNAIYEFRFRFVGKAKAFHFGFDPARGELKKKGHLFSVIVTPESWKILKHIDKNRRNEDPNETLAEAAHKFKTDKWYTMRVITRDEAVTAKIDDKETLKASHPTFAVKKPTLVFRVLGDGIEIDDIRVWKQQK